jgi:adenylosuccinate synthase
MPVTIVAGGQWGDEGKGRIVDLLAAEADLVIRCQGGPNAGHTLVNERGRFVLHAVPSGIFSERARCVIGAGCVIDPAGLAEELRTLDATGVDRGRLLISERAHLILPYHRLQDRLEEERRAEDAIGSTGQGVAPAYADKAARWGIGARELRDLSRLRRRLLEILPLKNRCLAALYDHPPLDPEAIVAEIEPAAALLAPLVGDTTGPVDVALAGGRRLLLEGQLGVMRDLDWGVYPFVTASSPTPAGMAAGAGVPIRQVDRVVGVVKAYATAVGAGPFPTEQSGPDGDWLRLQGAEYGATTGRPRRCGWFDAVAAAWAARVAGFTELALTKLDVLDGRATVPLCVAYREGRVSEAAASPLAPAPDAPRWERMPPGETFAGVRPEYVEFPGWAEGAAGARTLADLPPEARAYVREIERRVGVPVSLVGVGPEREAAIALVA